MFLSSPLNIAATIAVLLALVVHFYEVGVCATPRSQKCANVQWYPGNDAAAYRVRVLVAALALIVVPIALSKAVPLRVLAIITLTTCVLAAAYAAATNCMLPFSPKKPAVCKAKIDQLLSMTCCLAFLGVVLTLVVGKSSSTAGETTTDFETPVGNSFE